MALAAWRVIRKAAVALDLKATTSTLADSDSACKRRNTAPTSPASPAAHAASIAEEDASAREREVEHVHLLSALLLPRHRKLLRLPVRLLTIPCLLLQTRFSKLRHACRCRVVVHVHFARTPAAVGVQCVCTAWVGRCIPDTRRKRRRAVRPRARLWPHARACARAVASLAGAAVAGARRPGALRPASAPPCRTGAAQSRTL